MFDTHCHLNFDSFDKNLNKVVSRARQENVVNFLVPGVDIASSRKALRTADMYEGMYAAIGIHPTAKLENINLKEGIEKLTKLASNKKVVAIGETGLDYYKGKSPKALQARFFKEQIKLAIKLGLALVVHNRHSTDDLIDIINRTWTKTLIENVVFHCTQPDENLLSIAKEKRIFLGFNGDITYEKTKQDFIKKVPLDLIVIETDSPFLTPEPKRSAKSFPNEPANLPFILNQIATIKNLKRDELEKATTQNAYKLFNLY